MKTQPIDVTAATRSQNADGASRRLLTLGKAVDLLRGGSGSKADRTQSSYSQNGMRE